MVLFYLFSAIVHSLHSEALPAGTPAKAGSTEGVPNRLKTCTRVSTRKNQLLQNQLSSSVACTPTCKNLLVQISQLNSSSILQKTALNSDRKH